jgi:hypothetical protein
MKNSTNIGVYIMNEVSTIVTPVSLAWATKSGKTREASSYVGLALAPRAVRLSDAESKDMAMLNAGQYRPILREVVASFSGAKLDGLRAHIASHVANTVQPGFTVVVDSFDNVKANKSLMLAVAQWLASPYSVKTAKNAVTRASFSLTKQQALKAGALLAWAKPADTMVDTVAYTMVDTIA